MFEQLLALDRQHVNGTAEIFACLVQSHALKDHAREAALAAGQEMLGKAESAQAAAAKHGGDVASLAAESPPSGSSWTGQGALSAEEAQVQNPMQNPVQNPRNPLRGN